jgi:hypothetical protein
VSEERTSDLVARPGGVMTDEVGTVTGELTLRTEVNDSTVVQHVQYKDADEWYIVTDSRRPLSAGEDIDAAHSKALATLAAP